MSYILLIIVTITLIIVTIRFLWIWLVVAMNMKMLNIKGSSFFAALTIIVTKSTVNNWIKNRDIS